MSARYHINPNTGQVGVCKSDTTNPRARGCDFKLSDDEHYANAADARSAFEAQNSTFAKREKSSPMNTPWGAMKLSSPAQKAINEELARHKRISERAERFSDAPGSLNTVLTPSVFSIRDRGISVVTREEDEDLAYYSGDEPGPFIVISSRQGGGNNEYCYECEDGDDEDHGCLIKNNEEMESHPQFVYATDDSYDSTYRYAYFTFDQERYDYFLAADRLRKSADESERFQKSLKEGNVPPWGFNGDYRSRAAELHEAMSEEKEALKGFEKSKRDYECLLTLREKINNLEELNEDEAEFFQETFRSHANRWRAEGYATKEYNDLLRKKRELETKRKMVEQAEALPEGSELRDYLLKDRGEGSYKTTKKVGRRNQQVTVTYDRGSVLGTQVREAEESYESAQKFFQKNVMSEFNAQAQTKVRPPVDLDEVKRKVSRARRALWAEGWDESWGKRPAMPRDFTPRSE